MNGFERRKRRKQQDILEAALDLCIHVGIQKVSIAEIAKKAAVSQVTIYNYFDSKDNLIHKVLIYYLDTVWEEYERLFQSNIPFPKKIKKIIFDKKEASSMSNEFLDYMMKEYTTENSYIIELYMEKVIPSFMKLLENGKKQGYVDPSISNEAILVYIRMVTEYVQRGSSEYEQIIPLTEDLTKLFFYGLTGKKADS